MMQDPTTPPLPSGFTPIQEETLPPLPSGFTAIEDAPEKKSPIGSSTQDLQGLGGSSGGNFPSPISPSATPPETSLFSTPAAAAATYR